MKNLSSEAINELRCNARGVVRELGLLNDAYFDIGVTLAERHLLIELNTSAAPTMGEIAERFLLDKSTVSRLISKAVKKGYIQCIIDEKDKRRRLLQMTELGKKTLNAFEPIAFNQTKEALLTLSHEEVETVHRGIALYAKGLKNSRTQSRGDGECSLKRVESLAEITHSLNQLGCTLRSFKKTDEEELYAIFREVVRSGSQFPYEESSLQEFHRQFFVPQGKVYVCQSRGKIIGGFYLRANYSGRANHIANAAYMVREGDRGRGIGSLLIKASLHFAKDLGLQSMQFNMVLSQNKGAVKLYERLGFNIVGTIPQAIRNSDGSYQNGYVMHRRLDNL